MKWLSFILATATLMTTASADAVGIRFAVGGEITPSRYEDLKDYNTGWGIGGRSDFVWNRVTTTTLELGYRAWRIDLPMGSSNLEFHRLGIYQRVHISFTGHSRVRPYLGLGFTATNRDGFSLNIRDADMWGVTAMIGCEIPSCVKRISLDPQVRWEANRETDWAYSYLSFGASLSWQVL